MIRVIALDTETTGLEDDAGVCEIAVVELSQSHGLAPTKMWSSRIDPEKAINPAASAVHHITNEVVEHCPTLAEWVELVNGEPFEGDIVYVVGHNVKFDLGKLSGLFKGEVKPIDTLRLAKRFLAGSPSFSLGALLYANQLPVNANAHSALPDTLACVDLLRHIMAVSVAKTPEQLFDWSSKPLLVQTMPFGKHKGEAVDALPQNYVNWLLNLDDLDPDLRWSLTCKGTST